MAVEPPAMMKITLACIAVAPLLIAATTYLGTSPKLHPSGAQAATSMKASTITSTTGPQLPWMSLTNA